MSDGLVEMRHHSVPAPSEEKTTPTGKLEDLLDDAPADETWIAGTSVQVQGPGLSDLEPGTYFWRASALDAAGYERAMAARRALHLPDDPAVHDFAL